MTDRDAKKAHSLQIDWEEDQAKMLRLEARCARLQAAADAAQASADVHAQVSA